MEEVKALKVGRTISNNAVLVLMSLHYTASCLVNLPCLPVFQDALHFCGR